MKPHRSSFDATYIRWRTELASFESSCFEALGEFVRVHFDSLLDRYYWEGHESLDDFPAWAFERYLRETEPKHAHCFRRVMR
jgi:squalene cyclase